MILVEVAPTSVPPVCRIMDYGKYKYELSKKDHQSRRHQKSTQVKEIKLRPRTDKHDLEIKIRQMKGFLEEGNKTKVVLDLSRTRNGQSRNGPDSDELRDRRIDGDRHDRICPAHGRTQPDHDCRSQVNC